LIAPSYSRPFTNTSGLARRIASIESRARITLSTHLSARMTLALFFWLNAGRPGPLFTNSSRVTATMRRVPNLRAASKCRRCP
jgi:hypothetical protein